MDTRWLKWTKEDVRTERRQLADEKRDTRSVSRSFAIAMDHDADADRVLLQGGAVGVIVVQNGHEVPETHFVQKVFFHHAWIAGHYIVVAVIHIVAAQAGAHAFGGNERGDRDQQRTVLFLFPDLQFM